MEIRIQVKCPSCGEWVNVWEDLRISTHYRTIQEYRHAFYGITEGWDEREVECDGSRTQIHLKFSEILVAE